MKPKKSFSGHLGRLMKEHLALRRGLGRCYTANEGTLLRFNQLIQDQWPNARTVTYEMVMAFLRTNRHLKTVSRKNEVTYLRMFCSDLLARGVAAYVPERKTLPKSSGFTRVHIFTESEVLRVMAAAKRHRVPEVALNYTTLVGLYWTTGMRLQEALSLNVGDIDWEQRFILIREGKFKKSRIVPISVTTADALRFHLKKMRSLKISVTNNEPLFVDRSRKRLSKCAASHALHGLYRRARIQTEWGGYPRTHDLRHSFATHALQAIRKQGRDPSSYVPALAVVLGHSDMGHTQVYLHPEMETLQVASRAFGKKLLRFKGEVA